ncbi:hypothetical protein MHYP_G00352860 [Metynnis hypsauchen]
MEESPTFQCERLVGSVHSSERGSSLKTCSEASRRDEATENRNHPHAVSPPDADYHPRAANNVHEFAEKRVYRCRR